MKHIINALEGKSDVLVLVSSDVVIVVLAIIACMFVVR